jgi:ribosomal protein L24E
MTLELVEQTTPGNGIMYVVNSDGKNIKWFSQKETAEAFYDAVVADPNLLKPVKNILKSQEIDVPLD